MSLRIIGGAFRSRPLKSPRGEQTRPTLAVMRKAVFDILQSEIDGKHFLDLYAGSGAMGLEALSRGASFTTFVENSRFALECISANCALLKVETQTKIVSYDCLKALKKFIKEGKRFDIVYADPPYALAAHLKLLQEFLELFDKYSLLSEKGILFLEEAFPPQLDPKKIDLNTLRHVDTRNFSASTLHRFQRV